MGQRAHAERLQRVDAARAVRVKMRRHSERETRIERRGDPSRECLRLVRRPARVDQQRVAVAHQDQTIGGVDEPAERMGRRVEENIGRDRRDPDGRRDPGHGLDAEFENGGEASVGFGRGRRETPRQRADAAGAGRGQKGAPGRGRKRHLASPVDLLPASIGRGRALRPEVAPDRPGAARAKRRHAGLGRACRSTVEADDCV
jgi:hypothetical protein